jgi:anaerobic C4-dicarboxylate transporter
MFWVELILFLACILIGARIGGIGLGTIAGIGLVIFVFLFQLPPGSPPGTVLGMIIAVITALSVMQAAGGLDFLVQTAEKILRRRPHQITFLGPLVTYILVFAAGTQHVIYALLPVISEVSRRAKIRVSYMSQNLNCGVLLDCSINSKIHRKRLERICFSSSCHEFHSS